MKSSAVKATSSAASISVRRLSAVRFPDLLDLVAHDSLARLFVLQQCAQLSGTLALVGQLVLDDEDLEPGQAIQLQLEDRIRLVGVELEALARSSRPNPLFPRTCG